MSEEIFGYGFSLACDFLKELGFTNYVKPDVHLIDIFSGVGLSSKHVLDIFQTASQIANDVNETPYAVDKAFWLIGSGNLYLVGKRFKTNKTQFIDKVIYDWNEAKHN
jgi:thermostable 8-oxoguanine DNA glycosylase